MVLLLIISRKDTKFPIIRIELSKYLLSLQSQILDVAQLVAHLVRDQEVAGSSPVIQTKASRKRGFLRLDDYVY